MEQFLAKIAQMQKIKVHLYSKNKGSEPFVILYYPQEISGREIHEALSTGKVMQEDRILMLPERIFEHFFGV